MIYDYQLLNDEFCEDMNNLLNFGEMSNMWTSEEYRRIIEEMRPVNDFMERPSFLTNCRHGGHDLRHFFGTGQAELAHRALYESVGQ